MTPQEWVSFVLSALKAIVWPVALVIGARLVLPRLIGSRKFEFTGYGIKVAAAEQQEQQQQSIAQPPDRSALPATNPLPAPNRQAIQTLEDGLRVELARLPQQDRENVLLRALATQHLIGQHEFHYNRIFGSQIAGLKRLDEIGSTTVDQAHEFFEPVAKQYPKVYKKYGFDGWLGFMLTSKLVAREGDKLTATQFGHDFLVYLREARLTEAKPW
jgi:hypothetical protein